MRSPFLRVYLGKDGGKDISEWIHSLRYEDGTGKDNQVTLNVHQAHVNEVLDEQVITQKGEIFFRFGYLEGTVSEVHRAKIMDVNVDYAATIVVEIVALDKGNLMKKGASAEVWTNVTTKQIAQKIAGRYGLELSMSFSGRKWESIPQGNRDDMEFLKYVVRREEGGKYGVFVRNNTLYVGERGTSKASSLTIVYRDNEDLISFKIRHKEKESNGAPNSVTVASNDLAGEEASPRSGQSDTTLGEARVIISEGAEVLGIQKDGVVSQFTGAFDSSGEVTKIDPKAVVKTVGRKVLGAVETPKEAKNLAHHMQNRAALKVMTATLEIHGNPLIVPDTVITMAGLHKIHEGNWYVVTVTHTVDAHQYLTTCELSRNATRKGEVKGEKKNKTTGPDRKQDSNRRIVIDASTGDPLGVNTGDSTTPLR